MKPSLLIMLLMMIFTITSCDRPKCDNNNPVFNKFGIDSEEYKKELSFQIDKYGMENLGYWVSKYLEEDGREYLIVFIQNDSLCAKGKILIKDWGSGKFAGIKRSKGGGWSGAELKGFKFDIVKDSAKTEFIFKDVDKVID